MGIRSMDFVMTWQEPGISTRTRVIDILILLQLANKAAIL